MFIITDENMLKTDYECEEFSPFEDMEILSQDNNLCVVRTGKLFPTLFFMQNAWRKLWELLPDDEDWVEYNILTYYKPKK